MPEFTIIRPGGVATPGSTPITIPTVLPTGAEPPPAVPDLPAGTFTTLDYASTLAETTRTPIYQTIIRKQLDASGGATAYWTLDEGSGAIRNDSVGLQHLTSVNTVGQATGHLATGAQFNNASSRYLTRATPGESLLHHSRSFWITAWVKLDSLTTGVIMAQWGPASLEKSFILQYESGPARFVFYIHSGFGSTQQSVTANTFGAPSVGEFYFISAGYDYDDLDNSRPISISVNGLKDSTPAGMTVNGESVYAVNVGVSKAADANYFDGVIDDLHFYKRALTDEEVIARYQDANYIGTPHEFCSSHPSNRDPIGQEVLIPITLEQRADIEQSRFPLSTLTFALVSDEAGHVRAAVTEGLIGSVVDFYLGFWELPWEANKRLRFHGIITEIEQQAGIYQITARSPMSVANDVQVFDGAQTRLTADITAVATTIPVASTDAFAEPSSDINQTYPILIDDEFMFPLGRTTTSFTSTTRVGTFGFTIPPDIPNSDSTTHVAGAICREMVELGKLTGSNSDAGTNDLHPMQLLARFLTGSAEKASLNSSMVAVNTAELSTALATLGAGLKYKFTLDESLNAKAFAEKESYGTVGGYPRENASGELGIKLYQGASDATLEGSISDKDIIGWPHWLRNAEKIVNMVRVRYDYVPTTQQYTTEFIYRDETSIGLYGERPLIIESKGIRSEYTSTVPEVLTWFGDTLDFLLAMCQRQVARFGGKSPVLSFTTTLQKQLLQVGDDVELNFSNIPDIDSGENSLIYRRAEVQALKHDFIGNKLDFEVMLYPE